MNYNIIFYILSKMNILFAFFLSLPLLFSIIFKEGYRINISFIITIIITLVIAYIFYILSNKKKMTKNFYTKEGFVIVAFTWIIFSILGAIPFYLSGILSNYIDSFFESVSGLTTTGASVIENVEILPKSILFWRSLTHFIGGMGVIVFALAVLPRSPHNIHIMKAEIPGPLFGKVVSSIKKTSILLYTLYIGISLLMFILLLPSGIGIFESINITLSTAGTGGFSTKNTGIAFYNNDYVTIIVTIFMIIFSLNLNIVYIVLIKRYFSALNNEELKWFLSIIVVATIIIYLNIHNSIISQKHNFVEIIFTVSSIISTTGFSYINFNEWPVLSKFILLLLMISGGCVGGTAGGLKIPRIIFIFKNTKNYIKKCINPNKVLTLQINKKIINNDFSIANYIILYIIVFSIFSFILSFEINNFEEIFNSVLSTLNNIGPGITTFGPVENFSNVPYFSKFILTISMMLGRLEIIPFIVILSKKTWTIKNK